MSPSKAQEKLASNLRARRLALGLTQAGLSKRSGVPLSTLGKFEQTGKISVEALFKIMAIVGGIDEVVEATKPKSNTFKSIDDVLAQDEAPKRKRGTKS
jgi:transcriptional regulator with XRE-family HTH domain